MFYAVLSLIFLCQANNSKLEPSTVTFTGMEAFPDALKLINATGNAVVDSRNEQASNAKLSLNGKQTFWHALDTLCRQANCSAQWRGEQLQLLANSSAAVPVAYDGPFRITVNQCRVTNQFAHPEASRLTLQLELSSEPKLHPLLFKIAPAHIRAEPSSAFNEQNDQQATVTYRFEEGKYKLFDVNLSKPPRSQTKLTSLSLDGMVWVSTTRIDFESELLVGAKKEQQGTACQIIGVDVDDVSKTWEVAVKLTYPETSLDWESNQAGLLGKTMMVLVNEKKQRIASIGQEVRSDQGHQFEIRWLFRNIPGQVGAWHALIQTPNAPVPYPLKVKLQNIELP
jgi:hypothetical protein